MGKVILSTSYKGGVGKSTLAVNLSVGFALLGYNTVIVDLDSSVGCVELLLDAESDMIYNYMDYLLNRVSLNKIVHEKKIVIKKKEVSVNIITTPGSIDREDVKGKKFTEFVRALKVKYDYIIFDCPPGEYTFMKELCSETSMAIVISDHTMASIRAAEKSSNYFAENELDDVRLVINHFDPAGIILSIRPGICDIIESVKIRLLGIVMYNTELRNGQEIGLCSYQLKDKRSSYDFNVIISRIIGEQILLDRKYNGINTKRLYFKKKR